MSSSEFVSADIIASGTITGLSQYQATVKVHNNNSTEQLKGLTINGELPGMGVDAKFEVDDTQLTELSRKRLELEHDLAHRIIEEINLAELHRKYGHWASLIRKLLQALELLQSISVGAVTGKAATGKVTPILEAVFNFSTDVDITDQAFIINSPGDLERIEKVIAGELEGRAQFWSRLNLVKNKYQDVVKEIEQQEQRGQYPGAILDPGTSISASYVMRAPMAFTGISRAASFRVTYRAGPVNEPRSLQVHKDLQIEVPFFLLAIGGMIGGLVGSVGRLVIDTKLSELIQSWPRLIYLMTGSGLVAVVVSIIAVFMCARRGGEKSPFGITVEDFVGALVVGLLTGLFTPQVLEMFAPQ